jgi:hypothetical protein
MGFWEKVLPGYKGYKEREESRNTDKLLREFLANRLREARGRFDDFKVELTRQGALDLLTPAEKVTQTLSRISDRLRYANYGFTGKWFGGDKIGVAELDKVHEFDKQLATTVDEIDKAMKALEGLADQGEQKAAMKGLQDLIRKVDDALNEREQILRTFGGAALEK